MIKKRKAQLAAVIAIATLIAIINLLPFDQWIDRFRHLLNTDSPAGMLFFIFAGTLAIILFVPVSAPVTTAGLFFGFPAGLIPAGIILAAGAAGGFAGGRFLWPRIKSLPLFDRPVFQAARKALEHEGYTLLALLRMTPIMHFMTSNLFFGSLNLRFWPYLFASLAGMIPGTLLLVYAGSVTSSTLDQKSRVTLWEWAFFGVGILLFVCISWRITRKTRKLL